MLRMRLLALVLLGSSIVAAQEQDPSQNASLYRSGLLGTGVDLSIHYKSDLLEMPKIQSELKLTDKQKSQLKEVKAESDAIARRKMLEINIPMLEARKVGDEEAYQIAKDQHLLYQRSLTRPGDIPRLKALNREQRTRLEQIQLQADGPLALIRPEIARKLNFSPEQSELILEIVANSIETIKETPMAPIDEIRAYARLTPEKKAESLKSKTLASQVEKGRTAALRVRSTSMQQIAKVMTKGQRKNYEKMLGEPFDFTTSWPDAKPNTEKATEKTAEKVIEKTTETEQSK